jgi:hypothetical protein
MAATAIIPLPHKALSWPRRRRGIIKASVNVPAAAPNSTPMIESRLTRRTTANREFEAFISELVGPLAARSPGLRLAPALEIERHCSADEILQGRLIDLVAFVDVDRAPESPVEAGVE